MKRLAGFCIVGLLLLGGIKLKADELDFACQGTSDCSAAPGNGIVDLSSGNYMTSGEGIDVYDKYGKSGPYLSTVPFLLTFNTATGDISIDGTGIYAKQDFTGDIIAVFPPANTSKETELTIEAYWPTVPSKGRKWLGTKTGGDIASITIKPALVKTTTSGLATSVDVSIEPIPEPGSFVLVGTGLLTLATILRRRMRPARG